MAVTPMPARKRLEAIAQRDAEQAAQPGTERALHAGLHHVDAPQQQGDRAGEFHQRDGEIHAPPLVRERSSI